MSRFIRLTLGLWILVSGCVTPNKHHVKKHHLKKQPQEEVEDTHRGVSQLISPMVATINFSKDESELSAPELRVVKQIATFAALSSKDGIPMRILLKGYSGNGNRAANLAMSYKRALAVAKALTKINPKIICHIKYDTYAESMAHQHSDPFRKKVFRCVKIAQFYEEDRPLVEQFQIMEPDSADVPDVISGADEKENAVDPYYEILVKEC